MHQAFFCATLWWFLYIFSLKKMKPFRRSPFTGASFIIIILVSSLSKPRREQPKMAPNVHCLDSRAMLCRSASTKHHNRAGHVSMADWPLLVPGFPIFCRTTPVGPFGLLFRLAIPLKEQRTPWCFIKTVVISWLSWIPLDGSIRKIPMKSVQYTGDLHWFTGKYHGFLWIFHDYP